MRARDLGRRARLGSNPPEPAVVESRAGVPTRLSGAARPFRGRRHSTRLSGVGLVFLRGRDADAKLRALQAQRSHVRPVLGTLASLLAERRAWRALGFRNLSDYARERLGVGARTVSEWARVWRALTELPLLREAVLSGEVSWTVARLVVRLATPQNESACLETVRGRTVRAVEALLAAVDAADAESEDADSIERDAECEDRVAVRIACPVAVRGKWNVALELARRMAGEELPVWACAEAVAAEATSGLPAEPGPGAVLDPRADASRLSARPPHRVGARPVGSSAVGSSDREPGLRQAAFPHLPWRPVAPRTAREADRELGRLTQGLDDCTPHELDHRLHAAVALLQWLDFEFGRLLRQVLDRRLHRELGFASFERFVRERLDTAPRTARRLVRLARAEYRAPRVADAFRAGRVSAFQADVLLRVATRHGRAVRIADADTEARWLALAERTTLRRLEREANSEIRAAVTFHAPPDVAIFFGATLERVRGLLGAFLPPWTALETMLDHAIHTWTLAGEQFRDYADFERDGYRCTMPACMARSRLESHHVRFRSAAGADVPENRTTLCWFHHHAGVHEGRVRVLGRAPGRLLFELGVRPNGPPLARYRSGDVDAEVVLHEDAQLLEMTSCDPGARLPFDCYAHVTEHEVDLDATRESPGRFAAGARG